MRKSVALLFYALPFFAAFPAQTDTLVVGYAEAPPFIYEENGRPEGLNVRIWEEVMTDSGIPYRYVRQDFQEVLASLERGEIDLTIMPLSITRERLGSMDFSMPYFTAHGTVAVRNPSAWERFASSVRAFLNSNFLKGIFILLSIIFVFGFLGWYFEWRRNPEHFRKGIPGIWDGIWWSAVTLTTVGYGDKAPKTVFGKLAALLLMFGGLLFVSGITASIASSIALDEISNNMASLDQFKGRPVGTVGQSETEQFLKSHFFRDVRAYPYFEEGFDALQKGEIRGFLYDEAILKSEIRKMGLQEALRVLPIRFDGKFYAFGLAKGQDSLRKHLDREILKVREKPSWQMLLNEYGVSDFN